MAQLYDVGTRAWQPDPTDGWVASEVVDRTIVGDNVKLVFKLDSGEVWNLFIARRRGCTIYADTGLDRPK